MNPAENVKMFGGPDLMVFGLALGHWIGLPIRRLCLHSHAKEAGIGRAGRHVNVL